MGNGSYVYKEGDMSHEELYLKKRLVTFVKELSHAYGFYSGDETS